ncbi:hypothetical protein M1563_03845 [Patescibacteria group bacterium]|nr:hypothetical protein [Patescibacteria group bacterium]MCL5409575.1 hypothetical protein [Patescibacteria group bacterium]
MERTEAASTSWQEFFNNSPRIEPRGAALEIARYRVACDYIATIAQNPWRRESERIALVPQKIEQRLMIRNVCLLKWHIPVL